MINEVIAKHFQITLEEMLQKSNESKYVKARQIAMFFYREMTNKSLSEIGKIFNKHHATVLDGVNKVKGYIQFEHGYDSEIQRIRTKLAAKQIQLLELEHEMEEFTPFIDAL